MQIYDYTTSECVEVSDAQYDFMQAVIKCSGRMEDVRKEYPITNEQLEIWKADPIFWPVLLGHLTILNKSRGLTPEYIKSFLVDTLSGKKNPTKAQAMAINASVRALGMGLQPRSFNGKLSVTPGNTEIVFSDGLEEPK